MQTGTLVKEVVCQNVYVLFIKICVHVLNISINLSVACTSIPQKTLKGFFRKLPYSGEMEVYDMHAAHPPVHTCQVTKTRSELLKVLRRKQRNQPYNVEILIQTTWLCPVSHLTTKQVVKISFKLCRRAKVSENIDLGSFH